MHLSAQKANDFYRFVILIRLNILYIIQVYVFGNAIDMIIIISLSIS